MQKILYCDLKREYHSIKKEIDDAIERVFASGNFILGAEVEALEGDFAKYCNSPFAIGVASGTEALYISLMICGIEPQDEVITVANAGVPTICAITLTGARPVFADINPESYTIDVSKIEEKITERTKAVVPIHLYGQCADMDPILEIAKRRNLKVVEDACQAHGATYRNKPAGSMAHVGCFSFYPTKNLGGYGDGGMIITRDKMLAEKARALRNYGQISRYRNSLRGINSRLDEIQAAILRVKLKYLDIWNRRRFEIADMYNKNITNNLITKPAKMEHGTHVYHLYVIRCVYRDELREHLKDSGIETLVHYPTPVYLQEAYLILKKNGICPITERYSSRVLSLPLYPAMRDEEVYRVSEAVNKFTR